MSFLTRAVVMSAVGAVLAVQAFAVEPREDRGKGLAIAIAATSEQTGVLQVDHKEGFLVVLTNRSEKPIRLWKQECRLGYGTLSFEVSDDKTGERTRMHKHPLKWANVRKGRHQVLTIRRRAVLPSVCIPGNSTGAASDGRTHQSQTPA